MSKGSGNLAALIRREIGSDTNSRFLRSLPAFKLDSEIPARFKDLLGRLDRAEYDHAEPNTAR